MNIWITADTHFNHKRILEYCSRPFASIEEMDEALIDRWNMVVKPNHIVYHLGDFTLDKRAEKYLDRLNGKILFVPGSHDYWLKKIDLDKYKGKLEILPTIYSTKICGERIVMCHYPLASWEASFHGSLHLHAHSHGKMERIKNRFDIGVDCNDFYPFNLEWLVVIWHINKAVDKFPFYSYN